MADTDGDRIDTSIRAFQTRFAEAADRRKAAEKAAGRKPDPEAAMLDGAVADGLELLRIFLQDFHKLSRAIENMDRNGITALGT